MKDNIPKQNINAPKFDYHQNDSHRVAARMEGVVKNRGTRPVKKPKQG